MKTNSDLLSATREYEKESSFYEYGITDSEVKSIAKFLEPMRGPTDWMIQSGALLQLHSDLKTMIRVDLTATDK